MCEECRAEDAAASAQQQATAQVKQRQQRQKPKHKQKQKRQPANSGSVKKRARASSVGSDDYVYDDFIVGSSEGEGVYSDDAEHSDASEDDEYAGEQCAELLLL